MLSRLFRPFKRVDNFYGVNSKDSFVNMLDGEWDENSINIVSDPRGGIGSRAGFTGITTASVGASTAWCGFYQFRKNSGTDYFLGGAASGKIYEFSSNQYNQIYTGLSSTQDSRFSFAKLNDICVIVEGTVVPLKYTGSGSATTLGGTLITSDFNLEWQRYMWLHSSVDKRLMYYCTTVNDPESGYTSFLNFDQDPFEVTGACKQGDDMIVGKPNSLFRVQYTGSLPLFNSYRIPSTVGPANHFVMKELSDGKVIFMSPDFQVYMLVGDSLLEVGDNIKKFLKNGVNSRMQYAVSGLLPTKNQFWLSFTYTAGATKNDRTLVMDYSRPYNDAFGKLQYPWFIFSIAANCFGEIFTGGKKYLYHGGYTGKMYQNDRGTNDDGSAFTATYQSKPFDMGDENLEKKYAKLFLDYDNLGSQNLNITVTIDRNDNTRKSITQAMGNSSVLWGVAQWDVDSWAELAEIYKGRDIDRVGKLCAIKFSTTDLDAAWNVRFYNIIAKALRSAVNRTREAVS